MTDVRSGSQEAVDAEVDDAGVDVAGVDAAGAEHAGTGTHEHQTEGVGQDLHGEAGPRKDGQQTAGAAQDMSGGHNSTGPPGTEDSGASGSSEDGLQRSMSSSRSETSHEDSVMDSVMAAVNLLPSWTLQNKMSPSDLSHFDGEDLCAVVSRVIREADTAVECPFTNEELLDLARPIVEQRFAGQKKYKDQLKALVGRVGGEMWRHKFLSQSPSDKDPDEWWNKEHRKQEPDGKLSQYESSNEEYERWLDADDSSIDASRRYLQLFRRLALLDQQWLTTSAYELDFCSKDHTCGALTTIGRANINLRWMCELGDRFDIDPMFFIQHQISPLKKDLLPYQLKTWVGNTWFLDGVIAHCAQGDLSFVYQGHDALDQPGSSSACASMSCTKLVGSFFVVLHRRPLQPLKDKVIKKAVAIPVHGKTLDLLISQFFSDAWISQRLAKLASRVGSSNVLVWLLALFAYEKSVADLCSELRKLDYELVTISSKEALDRIKSCRAKVGRLRADIGTAKHLLCDDHGKSPFHRGYLEEDANAIDAMKSRATPRQRASTSMDAEYEWIDNEAASLMRLLNANLQILIATISLEDAAVTKKNGERSTLLTAFAAVYLPLTLATGVFGMNIREIGPDSTPRWWAFISLAAGLTGLSVFCIWLFFTRDVQIEHDWQRVLHRITGGWYGNGLERRKSDEESDDWLA